MEVQSAPNSEDKTVLLFKLQRKIKAFNTSHALPNRGYSLVSSCSKYGIVFVASPEGTLSIYYLKDLVDKENEAKHLSIKLQEKPTHIAVSCDNEMLAVTGGQLLQIYMVQNFQNQNVSPSTTINCGVNPSTFVTALQWNPCLPDTIAVAFYDGTLLVSLQASNNQVTKVQAKARCICWSPKGKQLVVGNNDGTITQYKPDLTPAKTVPAPNLFEGAPVEVLAIYWISTYQFGVVYKNAVSNSRPVVSIVNTPKGGQPICLNYDDVCYSMGSTRPYYYYLQGLAQWNLILASSSNSMEIATLASVDGTNWIQWCQSDEARPELPLTDKKQENYPVGISLDTCAVHQLPWGENETLPHMPLLHVVSHTGLLITFNVVNLNTGSAQLCTLPQNFVLPPAALTNVIPDDTESQSTPAPNAAPPMPTPVAPIATIPQVSQTKHPPMNQPQPTAFQAPQAVSTPIASFSAAINSSGPMATPQNNFTPATQIPQAEVKAPPSMGQVKPPTHIQPPTLIQPPKPQPQPELTEADLEKIKKEKSIKLKTLLIKEVNDFQMELYKFKVKIRELHIQHQRDLDSIHLSNNLQSLDGEKLKKDCSMEDLHAAIIQLKLDLVRSCAIIAEARTHAEAKDYYQWTQTDPLTTKRVASVKKLEYYVQSQLEQAHRSLDYKWNEATNRDLQSNKPGQRMIRPILDDVYQPLVKQQEILSRQQAVLRTLNHTLKECDGAPVFKSTSLLRNTPFRNKDPLSKLAKNILNMSIEPQNSQKESLLTPQKLDALRDTLANHKTVKIKPVNIDLRKQIAVMRLNHEKNLEEKAKAELIKAQAEFAKVQAEVVKDQVDVPIKIERQEPFIVKQEQLPPKPVPAMAAVVKEEPNQNLIQQSISGTPTFANLNLKPSTTPNVVRTLFTDRPKEDVAVSTPQQPQIPSQISKQPSLGFAPPTSTAAPVNTRSVLKEMLQSKTQINIEQKNDSNTFMGQKICSPTPFSFSMSQPASKPAPLLFAPKTSSDMKNSFNKVQSQAFVEPKPAVTVPAKETEEIDEIESINPVETKPLTNLFALRVPPSSNADTQNVPDVLKTIKQEVKKNDKNSTKVEEKDVEKKESNTMRKEIVSPETKEETQTVSKVTSEDKKVIDKENVPILVKPSTVLSSNSSQPLATTTPFRASDETKKPVQSENEDKTPTQSLPSNASSSATTIAPKSQSIFASPNVSPTQTSIFGSPTPIPSTTLTTSTSSSSGPASSSSSASSIFATAVASHPSSVFGSKSSTQGSILDSTSKSVTSTASSVFGSESATLESSSATKTAIAPDTVLSSDPKPLVFSTPTPATPASVFAEATSSIFGSTTTQTATSTTQSMFGTASSLFNAPTSPQSIFGSAVTTQQTSVFGSPTTTQSSIFSNSNSTPSIFGSQSTTQTPVFGTSTTTAASIFGAQSPVFGSAITNPTTQTSVFGTPTQSTQASVFGSPTNTTQASIFGTPTKTTAASVFGTPTPTTQTSVFGASAATTTPSGSIFGGAESNLFAAASISTTNAPSQASGGSIFGSSSGGNVFGSKATFGPTNPSAASIFGGNTTVGLKPAQSFWGAGNNSNAGNNIFASGSGGFGQQATTQASIFGGGSGGSFSSPSTPGQAFGSPQQSAFGGSPQQQNAPAFGGSPTFGSKPAFGQPSSFGSPPGGGGGFGTFGGFNKSPSSGFGAPASFGGGSTFGGSAFGNTSPGKMFGSTSPGFGAAPQSNATFESLATQNTLTFGNLAQQTSQQPQQAPSFNTSPSFTGWRG